MMKIKFKRKYILIFLLIIFLIFGSQIPAFIYNEYEFMVRANHVLAEMAFNTAEKMINMRTGNSDVLVSDQEKAALYQPINKAITAIIEANDQQKSYLDKQNKLLWLLPKTYREYHRLELDYFQDYSDSFHAYQEVKSAEHWLFNIISRWSNAESILVDLDSSTPDYLDKLKELDTVAGLVVQETKNAQAKGWLTEDLAKYLTMKNDKIIFLYAIMADPDFSDESFADGMKSISYIESRIPDFNQAFSQWHKELIDPKFNQGKEKYASAMKKLSLVDQYYNEHNLSRDWITVILAKFLKTYPKNINQFIPLADSADSGKIRMDLNGDANQEFLVIDPGNQDQPAKNIKSMIAYDSAGNVIASKPDEITVPQPMVGSAKIYRLKETDRKEAVSFEFVAGPHQSQVMFFDLQKDLLLPVCLKEDVTGPYDCLFFTGNVGNLPVMDLDQDGLAEVIETTDEYPSEGKLNQEEQAAITKVAGESETDEFTQAMEQIAKREKGGRGRTVVWAIFSYNGKFFEEQTGKDYDRLYNLIGSQIENKMKKSDLSGDSLAYLNLVRKLWNK